TEEPVRRLQTDNSVDRRWAADRSAGIGAQAKLRESGSDRGPRAAARSRRTVQELVWIFRLTACGAGAVGYGARFDNRRIGRPAHAAAAAGKLAKVHLGQHDRARLAQLLHHEGVLLRHMPFKKLRSRRRWHVNSVVVILQDDGDAMQRSAHFAALAFRIELPRLVERLFVE